MDGKAAAKLANALGISLDYLTGDSYLIVVDTKMLNRLEAIEQMPEHLKEKILFFIDVTIRDFKTQQAYS